MAISNKTSCVGEDIVVDVGVFQGGVAVLIEAIQEKHNAERDSGGE